MIEIEEIELKNFTLPNDQIGMVIMQPFVELIDSEPLHWQNGKKKHQIDRIIRTLEISSKEYTGCDKTHFTLFPEYSIPGLEGIKEVQTFIESSQWKNGTIIIGGVDGLTANEYSKLCNEDKTIVHHRNKLKEFRDDRWVNCCVVWVRDTNGEINRWIQPKIVPCWTEKNYAYSQMFCGQSIYLFKCSLANNVVFHFLSLICFDWIGRIDNEEGIWAILKALNDYWNKLGKKEEINLIIVLEYNDEPNHYDFLNNARNFFEKRRKYTNIVRDNCIVIFANTAGGSKPGKYENYGFSSLIFSPDAHYDTNGCPPSYALSTKKLRGTDNLGRCKDALFREMGACIHSLKVRLPLFVNSGPSDRCFPIDETIVHSIDDGANDARTPSIPVPASIKWTNDQLDKISHLLENENVHPLKDYIADSHKFVSEEIRIQTPDFLCKYIELCSEGITKEEEKWIEVGIKRIQNVENWNEKEKKSFETVVYALSVLKACKPLEIKGSLAHGTIQLHNKGVAVIDLIIVCGKTHKGCFEYAKNQYIGSGQRFAIIITHNGRSSLPERLNKTSILDAKYDRSRGPHIADPESMFDHCGYQNLIDCCNSESLDELNNKISELVEI